MKHSITHYQDVVEFWEKMKVKTVQGLRCASLRTHLLKGFFFNSLNEDIQNLFLSA